MYLPLSDENFTLLNLSISEARKPPLTYNGENDVAIFSRLFFYLILFVLAGNEDMHKISGLVRISELAALEV